MTIVTTTEAQAMLPRLLASVIQGEEVIITDGGLAIARLIRPENRDAAAPIPPLIGSSEAEMDEEDSRPWRGVFDIERRGNSPDGSPLQLSVEPSSPTRPADIFWDRVDTANE